MTRISLYCCLLVACVFAVPEIKLAGLEAPAFAQSRPQAKPNNRPNRRAQQMRKQFQKLPPQMKRNVIRKLASLTPEERRKLMKRFNITPEQAKKLRLRYILKGKEERLVRDGEIIGINMNRKSRRAARELGFTQIGRRHLPALGITVFRLAPPRGWDLEDALYTIKAVDGEGRYEANAMFEPDGSLDGQSIAEPLPQPSETKETEPIKIGVIDTGVFDKHLALEHTTIIQKNFGRGNAVLARDHGTAVASLIARYGRAEMYVADVFSGESGYTDAGALAEALNWMAAENVQVINMSLTGPDSFLLELAVKNLMEKGHMIVAAVGNEGPEGPVPYPAAYSDVIGVTAVDKEGAVYNKAAQGDFVDFAALGVDVSAATVSGSQTYSGTSFAVPAVSQSIAYLMLPGNTSSSKEALDHITATAIDMGAPGVDPVYGKGLISPLKPEEHP